MELTFEHTTNLGSGVNPAAVHQATNKISILNQAAGELVVKSHVSTSDIDYSNPMLEAQPIKIPNLTLDHLRINSIPRFGIFGSWRESNTGFSVLGFWKII